MRVPDLISCRVASWKLESHLLLLVPLYGIYKQALNELLSKSCLYSRFSFVLEWFLIFCYCKRRRKLSSMSHWLHKAKCSTGGTITLTSTSWNAAVMHQFIMVGPFLMSLITHKKKMFLNNWTPAATGSKIKITGNILFPTACEQYMSTVPQKCKITNQ